MGHMTNSMNQATKGLFEVSDFTIVLLKANQLLRKYFNMTL